MNTKSGNNDHRNGNQNPNYRHGMYNTPFYKRWENMVTRCRVKKHSSFKYYGALGIGFEPSWSNFINFKNDMFSSYKEGYDLSRKNKTSDFNKENCIWIPPTVCHKNQKNSIKYAGKIASDVSVELGGHPNLIYNRLRIGWDIKRAFTTPVYKKLT